MLRIRLGSAAQRLPYLPRSPHIFSRGLRLSLNPFFASNQFKPTSNENYNIPNDKRPNDPKHQVAEYIRCQKHFLDPNLHYPAVEITDESIMDTVLEHTFEPFETWKEISENQFLLPIAGSFIEFEMESKIVLGIVISEPQSKFNEYHNKLIVLTMDNELVHVYPQDIHFTAFQVMEKDWIDSLAILPNRFDEHYPARTRLVTILHQFVASANSMRESSKENLRIAYSRISNKKFMRPTSLQSVLELHAPETLPSYFHQSAKLISMHWEMCKDPSRWVVASCVLGTKCTNIVAHRCSNELPPVPIYMATPLETFDAVGKFIDYDSEVIEQLNDYITNLLKQSKSMDSLSYDLSIWNKKHFRKAFRAIIFSVFYPHERITNKLLKMGVFKHDVTPASLRTLLENVGLFDNPENPLTDIVYSSGLVGRPQGDELIVSKRKFLKASNSVTSSRVDTSEKLIKDYFQHLRNERQYYQDMVIYALPGPNGHSNFAFSLEKVNERRYLINIHVPDVASQLSPSSHTFESWSKVSGTLRTIDGLVDNEQIQILHDRAIELLLFSKIAYKKEPYIFSVGDIPEEGPFQKAHCLTLTYEYNIYESNPLKSIGDRVLVSFDSLRQNQVKLVDDETLERTLTGKLVPRFFNQFKLFSRTSEMEKPSIVDRNDHFNINFIYNTMTRHFLQRNRGSAASVEPESIRRSILKNTTFDGDTDKVTSKIHIEDLKEARKSQKRKFFVDELKIFAGAMAAEYCHKRSIPVYNTSQTILEDADRPQANDRDKDEVLISHENKFLPNFHGSSYFQTMLARDSLGYVSPAAYFIGNNYLGRQRLQVNGNSYNLPLGLRNGYVDVAGAMDSVEAYLNQLQILAYHHAFQLKAHGFSVNIKRFAYLKRYGYPLHGPLSSDVLEQYTQRLQDSQVAANYIRDRQRAFWTLVHVKQQVELFRNTEFNCIITRVGSNMNSEASLAWAFCEELTMEIRLYVRNGADLSIGSRVKADGVLHVDPDSGWCVLEYREPF